MNKKYCLIIVILLSIGSMPFFSSVSAQNETIVDIHIVGEDARTHFNNPVIVAGIWHYINVTPEDQNFQHLDIKFYKGTSVPGTKNESNYYEWKYNVGSWTDLSKYDYSYINADLCEKKDNTYGFCLGVKDTWPNTDDYFYYYENWTLKIYKDSSEIYSTDVVLEKPTVGLSKSHDDTLLFRVNPFSANEEISAKDNNERTMYFTIGNTGNVPLNIIVDYGTNNDITSVTNSSKKLSVQNTFGHYVTITSESWRPGILTIQGDVTGTIPNDLIITTAMITFNNSMITNAANLEISVGHSNYEIKPILGSNIVFQYENKLTMNENEIRDIKVYISGQGTVTLNVIGDENVTILQVTGEDQTGTPLTITSTDTSEYEVTIRVRAERENQVGIITYQLGVNGTTQTYETRVTIGPPGADGETPQGEVNIPISTMVVILLVIIVIGYMIFSQIRNRRR